jgi:hypothetical protein
MALYLEHMQREAFPTEKLEEEIAAYREGP